MSQPPFSRPPRPPRPPFGPRGPMPPWGDPRDPRDPAGQADPRREDLRWSTKHWDRRRSWGRPPFGPPGPPWIAHGRDWQRMQRGLFWRFAATFGILMLLVVTGTGIFGFVLSRVLNGMG